MESRYLQKRADEITDTVTDLVNEIEMLESINYEITGKMEDLSKEVDRLSKELRDTEDEVQRLNDELKHSNNN